MVLIEEWFRYMADTGAGEGANALYPQLKKHLGEHVGVEQFQMSVPAVASIIV